MGKKLIKNRKCKSIILLFLIFTTIVYLLHIYCINKNINGEWKQSGGGITGLPGFIYIDPNKFQIGGYIQSSDNLNDCHGVISTLYQEIAAELFQEYRENSTRAVYFCTDVITCMKRNANREGRENVPNMVIRRMYNSIEIPKEDELMGTLGIKYTNIYEVLPIEPVKEE